MDGEAPVYDGPDGETLCIDCAQDSAAALRPEADEWAREQVKLVREPHTFDEHYRFAPSPEDYAAGSREAYTENAVAAYNRHNCTNYDELIAGLDRYDPWDRVLYDAIRARVEELTDERLEALFEEDIDALLKEVED